MSYFKSINVKQDIELSTGNTSSVQLASGATFTGTAEETYGINGVQVFTSSDQDMTLYLDQGSADGTYEIIDSYPVYAGVADSRVFTSVAPFFRVRVTNNGLSTTTTFVQMTAMTPIISPMPRALTEQGGLQTTTDQNVKVAEGNSSSTNLAAGATWTGEPVSTLGVVGLQWNLNTDQNCTIYSEESDGSHTGLGTVTTNGTTTLTGASTVFERSFVVGDTISVSGETDRIVATIVSDTELTVTVAFSTTAGGLTYTHYPWDISYDFDFLVQDDGKGEGETVQATMAYWRLRVVNVGTATTTYFRASGVLCPIATPLPSSLSPDRRLKVEGTLTGQQNTDRHVWVSPTNSLKTNTNVRLVGTNFDGTTKDPNFWTETVANAASVVQTGEIKLLTGSTANGEAQYDSVRRARFVVGSALQFTGAYKFNDTVAEADNVRRCGAYDDDEGFYFQLDESTFSVGSRKETVDTLINSGSFNGNMGIAFTPLADRYYKLDIEWTPLGAFYYVNGELLHKSVGGHLTRRLSLPIRFENINDNSNDTEVVFDCLGVVIVREGQLETNKTFKYIGTNATTICKYGAGSLHRVNVLDNAGIVTIYDNTAASGTIIALIDAAQGSEPLGTMEFDCPFSIGLTVVTATAARVTVIYE